MSDHADLLRRAAARVRETLAALPAHHNTRWEPLTLEPNERYNDYAWWVNTDIDTPAVDGSRSYTTIAECDWSGADADHIALWHPGVAHAVAEWLDYTADHVEAVYIGQPLSRTTHHALAVARALLNHPEEST